MNIESWGVKISFVGYFWLNRFKQYCLKFNYESKFRCSLFPVISKKSLTFLVKYFLLKTLVWWVIFDQIYFSCVFFFEFSVTSYDIFIWTEVQNERTLWENKIGTKPELILLSICHFIYVIKKETNIRIEIFNLNVSHIYRIDSIVGGDHGQDKFQFSIKFNYVVDDGGNWTDNKYWLHSL